MEVLAGLRLAELENLMDELGATKFRARQIHNWIYDKSVSSIDEMTNLAKDFREELKKRFIVTDTKIKIKQSKVGCAVNCSFCATGKRGFIRNLTAKEIIEQVLTIQRDTGLKVTNIVFMGQGEPLLNLKNVLEALDMFNHDFQIGSRRITISTSGIIPKINELASYELQSTLAVSLHAPNHKLRAEIMPVENKYPIEELKKSLLNYIEKTGRRITIEYIMIHGFNDTVECAKELAYFLNDLKCNINLIPYNSVEETKYRKSSNNDIMKFKYLLEHSGKKVTVRLERGADIDAACGQLRGRSVKTDFAKQNIAG